MAESTATTGRPWWSPTLETFAVATFNLVTLSLVGLVLAHTSGGLAGSLRGVGTLPGVLTFGFLWLLTVGVTGWVFGPAGLARFDGAFAALVARGVAGGAAIAVGFVVGVALVGGLVLLVTGGELVAVAFLLTVGALGGAVVGGVVGLLLGLLDLTLYRVAGRLVVAE